MRHVQVSLVQVVRRRFLLAQLPTLHSLQQQPESNATVSSGCLYLLDTNRLWRMDRLVYVYLVRVWCVF
jgi:hypothetical protein